MTAPLLDWPIAALQAALAPLLPGVRVQAVAETDSTNTELMRRARAGDPTPTLLVAEVQSAGRGRLGRGWHGGAPGAALSFSLGLPLAPRDWSGLSLAMGLAVAESLHPDIALKWPNDLWCQDRKLAGILVETTGAATPHAPRQVVIGVGLNVQPQADAGFSIPPAWLQALLPDIDAPAALLRIAPPLVQTVRAFESAGFAPLAERFNARDALGHRAVRLSDGTAGMACGVAPDGALQLRTATGLHAVRSAEVSVRLQPDQPPIEVVP